MNSVAALYQMEEVKNNTFLTIASSYLQIIVNVQLEEVAQGQLDTSMQVLNALSCCSKTEPISKDDYLQSVAQTKRDEGNLIGAKNAVALSKLSAVSVLQLEGDYENFDIEVPEVNLSSCLFQSILRTISKGKQFSNNQVFVLLLKPI